MQFGYFICEEGSKLSTSEMPGEEEGNGEEDLQCSSLLTVCLRCFGLTEVEETMLE